MTKEEIIEMANKAKLPHDYVGGELMWLDKLEQFAKMVEEKKVENMANLADSYRNHDLAISIRTFGRRL